MLGKVDFRLRDYGYRAVFSFVREQGVQRFAGHFVDDARMNS